MSERGRSPTGEGVLTGLLDAGLVSPRPLERSVDEHDTKRLFRRLRRSLRAETADTQLELAFRVRALELGFWIGWLSIVVVLGGVALDASSGNRLRAVRRH